MDIKEVITLKNRLEADVAFAIREFETETGLMVDNVSIGILREMGKTDTIAYVKVEIKL